MSDGSVRFFSSADNERFVPLYFHSLFLCVFFAIATLDNDFRLMELGAVKKGLVYFSA